MINNNFISECKQVSINIFIAEFLKSNDYKLIHLENANIISNPNIFDFKENKDRWNIFKNNFWLFNRFMPHCDWFESIFKFPESFGNINVINEESWTTDIHSRDITQIEKGEINKYHHIEKVELFMQNKSFVNEISKKSLIILGRPDLSNLTVIDGNHRVLTLYSLYKENIQFKHNQKVILGLTNGSCRWLGDKVVWQERPATQKNGRFILNIW